MRVFLFSLVVSVLGIGLSQSTNAQTVSSKIMDVGLNWTSSGSGVDGQVNVFLTDTMGIAGVNISYGATDSTSNYFSGNYATIGSFVSGGGSIDNGELALPIGHFASGVTGYLKVTVLLSNGSNNMIDVMK